VHARSIEALRRLNALGYGCEGSGRALNLVYNPLGPSLPPAQSTCSPAPGGWLARGARGGCSCVAAPATPSLVLVLALALALAAATASARMTTSLPASATTLSSSAPVQSPRKLSGSPNGWLPPTTFIT
jgi:hypothetical protein